MWWRKRREQDLDRELCAHLDLEAEERGDAYAARRALGNTTRIKEEVREMWGWTRLEELGRNLRHAVRSMLYGLKPQDPSTAIAATGLLALAAVVASLLPAWRATRVDPMTALRNE